MFASLSLAQKEKEKVNVEIRTSSNYILQSRRHALSYNLRNDYDIERSRNLSLFLVHKLAFPLSSLVD